MNWLQKAIYTFRQAFSLTDATSWREQGGSSSAGVTVTQTSMLALSAAWSCINLIAGTIGSLPLMVYRTDRNGVRSLATDHPLYRLLHDSPNADQTAVDFWEFMQASLEMRGDAFADPERANDGRLISLTPVRPDIVTTKRLEDGDIEYRWTDNGVLNVRRSASMFHIRGFGGGPLGGLSTMAYGRDAFGLASAIEKSAAGTFANGLRPAGALTFKEWLTVDQRKLAEENLVNKYVGAINAGRPMVLEGGTEWKSFSITPEDSQMLQSRSFSVEEICRFFGVPPIMVGHGEKTSSWGTGVQEVTLGFLKYTLRRRLKRIEQAIGKQLLTPRDRAQGLTVEFNIEGLLRGDSKARAEFYQSALANGWMTVNEVRRLENMAPVEGGDVCRVQMQNVPLAEAGIGHNGGPPLENAA